MGLAATAAFYHQLATLVRAGFPLSQALNHAATASGGWQARNAAAWSSGCGSGLPLHEQLAASGENPLAVALVRAGERSGRLPELCDRIAAIAEHLQRLRGLLIGRLIYPFMLAHAALMIPAVPKAFMSGNWGGILVGPAILWSVIGGGAFFIWFARRSGLGGRLALQPGPRFLTMPWVAANICQVVEAGIAAGMLFHDALELAAPACGNAVMAARLHVAAEDLRHGRCPSLTMALRQVGLPITVVQLVEGAEISGTLEIGLARTAAFQREQFESRSLWAGRIAAGMCFGAALLGAAWAIISMYAGYIGHITEMANEI